MSAKSQGIKLAPPPSPNHYCDLMFLRDRDGHSSATWNRAVAISLAGQGHDSGLLLGGRRILHLTAAIHRMGA